MTDLENSIDKNSIPKEDLIENAGVIVGWLFWKRCFDKFGWLQEGRFYKKDGIYTGTLAANWLTRLAANNHNSINPLMITICDLSADDSTYISNTELEDHLKGESLEESIDSYYTNLMSMWPILEANQRTEFNEFFMQREGVMTSTTFGWNIKLKKAPYDLLMNKSPIPWPLSMIRFSWTNTTIGVQW